MMRLHAVLGGPSLGILALLLPEAALAQSILEVVNTVGAPLPTLVAGP